MRYIKVEATSASWPGYSLDADEYIRVLPAIQDELPDGARRFALDEEHYNFFGPRCVKDLKLSRVTIFDANDQLSGEIEFAPNKFKHNYPLTVRYFDIVEVAVEVTSAPRETEIWPDTRRLGDVQLDEILPVEGGCSHEIRLTGGTILIVASDLRAEWHDDLSDAERN